MSAGDVLSCIIDKTGTYAHVKLSALSAGGSYNFGTLPASPTVTFTVTSLAYDNAGNATTTNRTVLGTINVALPDAGAVTTSTIPVGAVTGGPFAWGETITQTGSAATAVIVIGSPCSPLIVKSITGTPNSSGVWTGGTSGATATPSATPSTYTLFPNWEGADGSDLWVTVALSDSIYASDTSITLNTSSGWYTGATATTNFSCTNQSTLAYPQVICQWVTVPAQRFTGVFTVECMAFQKFATGGKPVACVQFTASDGTNTVSQTVTSMTLSATNDKTITVSPIATASATAGLVLGETAKQGTTNATAVVISAVTGKAIFVNNIVGTPDATHAWVGQTSSTSITPTDIPAQANRVCVYAFPINANSFIQGATVTCNFTAYPWIGDSGATYTTVGKTAWPSSTEICGPIPFVADKGNSYGVTTCYVDQTSTFTTNSAVNTLVLDETLTQATSGATAKMCYTVAGSPNQVAVSEITGSPDNSHTWTGGTSGATLTPLTTPTANASNATAAVNDASHPAQTATKAAQLIAAFNNANFARNTCDAGIIYLKKGRYIWDNSDSLSTCSKVWLTWTRAPGLATNDVRVWGLTTYTTQVARGHQRMYDLDVYGGTAGLGNVIVGYTNMATWLDSCRIVGGTTTGGILYSGNASHFTNNAAYNQLGWAGFGNSAYPMLFRGNVCASSAIVPNGRAVVGNTMTKSLLASVGVQDNTIIAFNACYNVNIATGTQVINLGTGANTDPVQGCAIIGNLIEGTAGTGPTDSTEASENGPANHVLTWHCTYVGQRSNYGYNDTTAVDRTNFSRKYTSNDYAATKHDRFNPADPTRNKGWSVAYGLGNVGNNMVIGAAAGGFPFYYEGIGCTSGVASNYTAPKASNQIDPSEPGGGYGDYHPAANSVLRGKVTDPVIPFDLAGAAISVGGAAGALQPSAPSSAGSGGVGMMDLMSAGSLELRLGR